VVKKWGRIIIPLRWSGDKSKIIYGYEHTAPLERGKIKTH
jgi:hypothetical protein